MLFPPNPASGVPIYHQLMDQIKHAITTGAIGPGDQLPSIRKVAEDLVINPNTVVKAYRELEYEGVIEMRHGTGAFVRENGDLNRQTKRLHVAVPLVRTLIVKLREMGLSEEEIRRLFESEFHLKQAEEKNGTAARTGRE
jgi:GntR family transcriptional regulator